jgi:acetyl esterase
VARPIVLVARGALAVAMVVALGVSATAAQATPAPRVTVMRDVAYRVADDMVLPLDAYVPTAKTTKRPAVLLVHGGAWRGGDKSNFAAEGNKLAELGYVAFSVSYRLAPQHPYPAAVDDVLAAVEWIRAPEQVKTYKLDPKRIGAIGASAGGHLVAMLATMGEGPQTKGSRIKAAVSWSGPMDFNLWPLASFESFDLGFEVLEFLDCTDDPSCPNATPASPITHVDGTDAAILLATSDAELIGVEHATSMDAALKAAGVTEQLVIYPGSRHAHAFGDDIWPQTVAFLAKYVGKPPRR